MKLPGGITTKPWETVGTGHGLPGAGEGALNMPKQKVALRFFLVVVAIMFGLFLTAYYVRMELEDWRPTPEPRLLWVNTGILVLASFVLQWTRMAVSSEKISTAKIGLLLGGILSFAFIFGQVFAWRELIDAGYLVNTNPANGFFYVLTGIHALHLLGGLWVWTRSTLKLWSGGELQAVKLSVELCSVYWHFLLIVWVVLFAVMSVT